MVRTKRPVLLNGFFNLRAKRSIQSASIQMDQALGILIEPVRLKVGTGSILFGDLRVHDGRLGKTSGSRRACFGAFSRYKGSTIETAVEIVRGGGSRAVLFKNAF
jgi:hypothetical protein